MEQNLKYIDEIDPIEEKVRAENVHYRIVTSADDFDKLEGPWNRIVTLNRLTVFQTFEWNRTWWKHFGSKSELRIFVLYREEQVVGIAPLFLDRFSALGKPVYSCLRMIGSTVFKTDSGVPIGDKAYSDYLQVIVEPDFEEQFFAEFLNYFDRESEADELIFDELPQDSATLHGLTAALNTRKMRHTLSDASETPVIMPEEDWESYLMTRSTKERNNIRRYFRRAIPGSDKLFDVHKEDVSINFEDRIDEFITMHQKQWHQKGLPGSFAEKPMHDFSREVAIRLHRKGMLHIYTAEPAGEEQRSVPIAFDLVLVDNERMLLLHRALDYEAPLTQKAPGHAMLMHNIKEAITTRRVFDFLRGEHSYKSRLATTFLQNKSLQIPSRQYRKTIRGQISSLATALKRRMKNEHLKRKIYTDQAALLTGWSRYIKVLLKRGLTAAKRS